ncbi:F0F1 ATP synthase subunit epsilon [Aestuariimicrobium ganziense]|uniref:F0F1 ATP synthase subunit epsilon n=1 Tax=Aestuariimicrobium ganziense TaxID=2773677 RepID=UPI0019424909|nr:F0F1 ATP synthase subunit epsilon [Aestuariimicrobium ganziense]
MAEPFVIEVVSADRLVFEGRAVNVIVRTTEGDIGILPGHEPLIAVLVPCAAEIVTDDGRREVIAVDGGFMSVSAGRVSLLSQFATLAGEITPTQAQRELDHLQRVIDAGDHTDEDVHRMHIATAQLKAVEKST